MKFLVKVSHHKETGYNSYLLNFSILGEEAQRIVQKIFIERIWLKNSRYQNTISIKLLTNVSGGSEVD